MVERYLVAGVVPVVVGGVERRAGDVVATRDCAPGQLEFLLATGALVPLPPASTVGGRTDGEE